MKPRSWRLHANNDPRDENRENYGGPEPPYLFCCVDAWRQTMVACRRQCVAAVLFHNFPSFCVVPIINCPVNLWVVSMCYIKPSMWTCACCVLTCRNINRAVSCPMFLCTLFIYSIPSSLDPVFRKPSADNPKCLNSFVIEIELIW